MMCFVLISFNKHFHQEHHYVFLYPESQSRPDNCKQPNRAALHFSGTELRFGLGCAKLSYLLILV